MIHWNAQPEGNKSKHMRYTVTAELNMKKIRLEYVLGFFSASVKTTGLGCSKGG